MPWREKSSINIQEYIMLCQAEEKKQTDTEVLHGDLWTIYIFIKQRCLQVYLKARVRDHLRLCAAVPRGMSGSTPTDEFLEVPQPFLPVFRWSGCCCCCCVFGSLDIWTAGWSEPLLHEPVALLLPHAYVCICVCVCVVALMCFTCRSARRRAHSRRPPAPFCRDHACTVQTCPRSCYPDAGRRSDVRSLQQNLQLQSARDVESALNVV